MCVIHRLVLVTNRKKQDPSCTDDRTIPLYENTGTSTNTTPDSVHFTVAGSPQADVYENVGDKGSGARQPSGGEYEEFRSPPEYTNQAVTGYTTLGGRGQ